MSFLVDTQELKAGLVIFRRADVQHQNWYCRVRVPRTDKYKTISLKTADIDDAKEKAFDHDADIRFRVKHDVPVFDKSFEEVAKEYSDLQKSFAGAGQITMRRWKVVDGHIRLHLVPYIGNLQILHVGEDKWRGYVLWRKENGRSLDGKGITSANIDQFSKYPCYGGNGLRGFTSRFTHNGSYTLIGRQGALCGNVFAVEGRFFASEHAIVVTASAKTDIRWLTCMLGKMNLNQYSESSAQPGLSVSKILNLDLAVPPTKAEQTAIAEVLSDMDAELAALERRRDKTQALKQGIMQDLLTGRTRLVGPQKAAA